MGLLDEIRAEEANITQSKVKSSLLDEIKTETPSFYNKYVSPVGEYIESKVTKIGETIAKQNIAISSWEDPTKRDEAIQEAFGKVLSFAPLGITKISKESGIFKKGYEYIKKKLGIPPLTEKGIKQEVLNRFNELINKTEAVTQVQDNIKYAKELEKKIPNLKFSYGQLTNDADAISLERGLARGGGASLSQKQREIANKILEDYYTSKVITTGKPKEFVSVIAKEKAILEAGVKQTQQAIDLEVMRLSRHVDEQGIGKTIYTTLSKGKLKARNIAKGLYNQIPDVKLKSDILKSTIDDLQKEFDPLVENPSNFPNRMINGFLNKITKKVSTPVLYDAKGIKIGGQSAIELKDIGFQELRKMRSQVIAEIRTQSGAIKPNDQLIRRLKILQDGIEDTINTLENRPDNAGELYRQASSFYKEYASKFKQGTVADILAKGSKGEETRIASANIANRFDNLDGIDDFIKAIGDKNTAKNIMRDYYQFDFLNKARTPDGDLSANKTMQWLYKNAGKLKKLDLFNEFKEITMKRYALQNAEKNLNLFNKSVANRIIEADIDNFVTQAFRGSKNYGVTAQELLNKVKGNKSAEEGLKKAFAENLMKESETTAPGFFQTIGAETISEVEFTKSVAKLTNNIKKYIPAIKIIYKDEPQKIKAINDVWNAYQILARTAKSPLGGGSDTMENIFNVLIGAGGARAGRFYLIKSIRDAFSKYSERHINEYMRRVIFDPDYAINLVSFKTGITPEKLHTLRRLMIYAGYKGIEYATEEQEE